MKTEYQEGLDTFDLLLTFHEDSGSVQSILNKLLPAAPLMWHWVTLSDTSPRTIPGHRMPLVRITPESAGAQEAIFSRLAATVNAWGDGPLVWFRQNKAPIVTARQRAIDTFQAYHRGPAKTPAEVIDAIVAAVVEEVKTQFPKIH